MISIGTVQDEIDIIYSLDCDAYPEETTDKQWYFDRYDGREEVYVYSENNLKLGYCIIADINKEMAEALVNGVLDGDVSISNNMFRGDGQYKYLASFVVNKDYRHKGIFSELLKAVLENHKNDKLYVLANKHTAKAFENTGFTMICDNGHYKSFTLNNVRVV